MFYLDVSKHQRDVIQQSGLLDHSNAPAHLAVSIKDFLTKHNIHLVSHPQYLLDLAPSDFFVSQVVDKYLKGKRFQKIPGIIQNAL
jgi:hypothetical protein